MRTILPRNAVTVPDNAKRVFRGIIYDTYHWEQELFDGTSTTFEMLKRPDTVKVIAVDKDKIVLLEQHQPNQNPFFDIPGGTHDHEEETELQGVQRELLEETGLEFSNWKLLNVVQPHRKIEQFVYTFLATNLKSKREQQLDGGEKISVRFVTFDEAKELLSSEKGRYLPTEIGDSSSLEELLSIPGFDTK